MKPFSFKILFTIFIALVNFPLRDSLYYPQYLQASQLKGCGSDSYFGENILESRWNITNSKFSYIKSVYVRGIWKVNFTNGAGTDLIEMTTASSSTGESTCARIHGTYGLALKSAVMPLPSDLDESALGLFSSFTMGGSSKIIKSIGEEKFDLPMTIGSWGITGSENYTVFEHSNFTGISHCLAVSESVEKLGWGITYNFGEPDQILFKVGSVRRGCANNSSKVVHGMSDKGMTVVLDKNGNKVKDKAEIVKIVLK